MTPGTFSNAKAPQRPGSPARSAPPVCRECGGAVAKVDVDAVEDELRSQPWRTSMRPGAVWHTCERGHRVKVARDPGPRDPIANARVAARYLRDKYGLKTSSDAFAPGIPPRSDHMRVEPCGPCAEFQRGEREDLKIGESTAHVCERVVPGFEYAGGPCPCGCDKVTFEFHAGEEKPTVRRGPMRGEAFRNGEKIADILDIRWAPPTIVPVDVDATISYETGEELDTWASRMFGLTRAPGESDEDLRARVLAKYHDLSPRPRRASMPPTRNPYDRRNPEPFHSSDRALDLGGPMPDILDDGRRAYPGLTLARLEELTRDEFARGFNAGEGTMERKLEEEILPAAKRMVWTEGHVAGFQDGRAELLAQVSRLFEDDANGLRERLAEFFDDCDPAAAWRGKRKVEAMDLIAEARDLLSQMAEQHHKGFVGDIPF